jgi:hypothetical protein
MMYYHFTDKSIPFEIIFKIFGQVKIQILKIKQDMNLNYKETCSPILDRCWLVIIILLIAYILLEHYYFYKKNFI